MDDEKPVFRVGDRVRLTDNTRTPTAGRLTYVGPMEFNGRRFENYAAIDVTHGDSIIEYVPLSLIEHID